MEIGYLVLFLTVFGATIYSANGAYSGKSAKANELIENFTSDDIVGNWSFVAAVMRSEFRDANVTGICANVTVSREDSQSLQTVHWTGLPFNDNASLLQRSLAETIPTKPYKNKFNNAELLFVAESYFVTKYLADNSVASSIALRQGYAPTISILKGILKDMQNLGIPVTHIKKLCTTDEHLSDIF